MDVRYNFDVNFNFYRGCLDFIFLQVRNSDRAFIVKKLD